jgi:hypothetical protein
MSEQKRSRRWIVPRDGSFTRHPTKTAPDYGLMRLIPRYHHSRRRCAHNRRRLRFRYDRWRRFIAGQSYFATPRSDRAHRAQEEECQQSAAYPLRQEAEVFFQVKQEVDERFRIFRVMNGYVCNLAPSPTSEDGRSSPCRSRGRGSYELGFMPCACSHSCFSCVSRA